MSTLPLPVLLGCARGLPPEIARWADLLEVRDVSVVQVAIENRGEGLDALWTYFPDPEIPFYRLVRLELLSPDLAPPGGGACLLECGGPAVPDDETAVRLCRELGVAAAGPVSCVGRAHIPYGYVLFKEGHRAASERAIAALAEQGVHVAGRYGTWSYLNIEQTLETGLRAAAQVLSGS